MNREIIKGITPPLTRGERGVKKGGNYADSHTMNDLIALAHRMEVGDCVALTLSESQTMRIILAALGFRSVTDGWRCPVYGSTYIFKLSPEPTTNTTGTTV